MGKGRTPCCEKGRVKKGPWSQAEDLKLLSFIQRYGHSNWRSLPKLAGLARCGKSCRLRWVNYLRPDVKRGSFAPEEEDTIIRLQSLLGNKWSKIASHLPGRTDNEIKNVWNTHLKKRLSTTRKNNSKDSKTTNLDKMSPSSSKDNGTMEFSSSDCTTGDYSNHDVTLMLSSRTDGDKNINEPPQAIEIPYDEPNMVDLWDSLLLDVGICHDQSNSNIGDSHNMAQSFATFEANTQRNNINNIEVNNSFGWQFEMLENFEHETMNLDSAPPTLIGDEEKNKCDQLHGLPSANEGLKLDNMESYLEIMAWPTSPTYDSYLGL